MSTYDYLASKAKRMRKRLHRVTGDYRQAASSYSSAFKTYETEAGELQDAFKFRKKWGDIASQYITDKTTGIETEYKGDDGATGKFGAAKTDYLGKLSAAQGTFNIGKTALDTEYYGDPDDDTSSGKFGGALSTYEGALESAGTTATEALGTLNVEYYGKYSDAEYDLRKKHGLGIDEASTGKFRKLETDYQTKLTGLDTKAIADVTKSSEKFYGIADDPETEDVDEFQRGKIHDVQDTFRDTTETGKRLGEMSNLYGVDIIKYSGDADTLKALGGVLRKGAGTIKAADTDIHSPHLKGDSYGVYGEAMWGHDVLSKWLKGEVDDKYKEYQNLGTRAMDALGLSRSGIKAEGNRIYEKYTAGSWWERETKWRDITHHYTDDVLSGQLEKRYSDTGVKKIEDDLGYLTGSKFDYTGKEVKARPDPVSFDDWLKKNPSVTYDSDGTPVHKSKDEMKEIYGKEVMGMKNFDTVYDSTDYSTYLTNVEGVDTAYGKEETGIKDTLALDKGAAGTTYKTDFGILEKSYGTESTRIQTALEQVLGIMDDPDTEKDETVMGSAEKTYRSSVSTLNTELTTKLGKLTTALAGVTGTETEKGSALTGYETKVGELTTDYTTALQDIYKDTGYTVPKGKFETAKETYEREEGEYETAYERLFGKKDDEKDTGAEGVFTSAKSTFDTLSADYTKLAGRIKKYERLGLLDPTLRSKSYKRAKVGAGSYL